VFPDLPGVVYPGSGTAAWAVSSGGGKHGRARGRRSEGRTARGWRGERRTKGKTAQEVTGVALDRKNGADGVP